MIFLGEGACYPKCCWGFIWHDTTGERRALPFSRHCPNIQIRLRTAGTQGHRLVCFRFPNLMECPARADLHAGSKVWTPNQPHVASCGARYSGSITRTTPGASSSDSMSSLVRSTALICRQGFSACRGDFVTEALVHFLFGFRRQRTGDATGVI